MYHSSDTQWQRANKLLRRQKNSEKESMLSIPALPGHLNEMV